MSKTTKAAKHPIVRQLDAAMRATDLDKIVTSKATSNGASHYVASAGGKAVTFSTDRWVNGVRKASVIGASFAALEKELAKPAARPKLARGITGRDAPNASKAIADANAKAKPAAAKKAARAQAKAKVANPDRPYKALVKFGDLGLREGTWTYYMVQQVLAHTSTAKASAATLADRERHYRHPNGNVKALDFNWSANVKKFIQFTD